MSDVRARVEASVAAFVREHAPWQPEDTVVAAVSGGADSLCLLGALFALRSEQPELAPGRIVVAHLDHGLRGEAGAADAAWVAAFASALDLDCVTGTDDVAALARGERRSLEDAARHARYTFLRRVAAEQGATRICVGHTRDDQAETIVMHWLRGSGLTGLSGMRPLAGDVARPLLAVSRDDTVAYCAARGWQPRSDSTNDDVAFLRNRIRHVLLPELERYNPNLRGTLLREAELYREDDSYLDARTTTLWVNAAVTGPGGALRFSLPVLRAAPTALCRRLLRRAAERTVPAGTLVGAGHVLSMERLLREGRTGSSLNLPGRLRVTLEYDTLSFGRERRRAAAEPAEPAAVSARTAARLHVPGSVELPAIGWRILATTEPREPGAAWSPARQAAGLADPATGHVLAESEALLDADMAARRSHAAARYVRTEEATRRLRGCQAAALVAPSLATRLERLARALGGGIARGRPGTRDAANAPGVAATPGGGAASSG